MEPGNNVYSDADVLFLDAQFSPEDFETRQDYGHANIHMAVDFAVRERTKKLYLFHQSPTYSDSDIQAQLERARDYLKTRYKGHPLQIEMTVEQDIVTI
jgi:ribonuclease BN (tRNA processing enzyme)